MSRYLMLSYPLTSLDNYVTHPSFQLPQFVETVLSLIQDANSPVDIVGKWFDTWDMVMTWMAMRETLDDPALHKDLAGRVKGTIRGTVLNHSDLVTDIANHVIECGQINFVFWKPVLNYFTTGMPLRVIDITPTGILIEVVHEQQAA